MYVCVCVKLHAQTKVKFIREVVIEHLVHTCPNIWKHVNTILSLESQFIYNAKGLYNFSEKKKEHFPHKRDFTERWGGTFLIFIFIFFRFTVLGKTQIHNTCP